MARLILHVGTHKTGSTAIQEAFHSHRDILARHGVIYPSFSPHAGHHALLTDWIQLPKAYLHPNGGEAGLVALAEAWRDQDVTLVLSSEEFSRGGGAGGRADLARVGAIFSDFDDVVVLCFLREPWTFLQSVYLEIARERVPPAPHVLCETATKSGIVDGLWADYGRLHGVLREGFPEEKIHLLSFESASRHNGGVIGYVLAQCGVDIPEEIRATLTRVEANRSALPLPTWAAFAIAGGPMPTERIRTATEEAFNLEFGRGKTSTIFTPDEIEAFSEVSKSRCGNLPWRLPPSPQDRDWVTLARNWINRANLPDAYWVRVARRLAG